MNALHNQRIYNKNDEVANCRMCGNWRQADWCGELNRKRASWRYADWGGVLNNEGSIYN